MSALTDFFTSLANKVRAKLGTTDKYTPANAVAAIDDIYTKGVSDTKKGNATAGNVLSGKTFTSNSAGVNQTGTMADYSNSRITVTTDESASSVDKPAMRLSSGNYEVAMPTGYWVRSWANSVALIPAEEKTQAPSTSPVAVTPTSGKVLSKVTVSAITPVRSYGTEATLTGIASASHETIPNKPYVYFPYGWWPNHNTYGNLCTLTAAQAKAVHAHTDTYTLATSETGTKDLGVIHSYRYINAAGVYNEGRYQIDFDGQKTYSGSEATPAVTYTCGTRGMYLVIAYSTTHYMSAPSITISGTGTLSSTTYYIDANSSNSSQAKLVIRAVLNCAGGTTLTVAAHSGRSRLTFIRIR